MQAAIWCVFSLYSCGEFAKAVSLLSQAYALVCLNGLNRLDDPISTLPQTVQFSSPVEEEECRCTLWALFVLDRHINAFWGRYFVIDDLAWCVNYPLDDLSLQRGLAQEAPEPYNRDMAALASFESGVPIQVALTRLVCKATVILGRIASFKSIIPPPAELAKRNRAADMHEFQSTLACFWVSIPPCVHNITEVPPENAHQSVWLLIVLHICSTMLFYTNAAERRAGIPERIDFSCAYKSVDKTVTALHRISEHSIDSVLNPMLASPYFLCSRFVLVRWRLSQQQSHRLDLSFVLRLLGRMAEGNTRLPLIYKDIIDKELAKEMPIPGGFAPLPWCEYCFVI